MTVSTSGKLPKLIAGPLVNSPIDGGTESDVVEKKINKNTKGNKKKDKSVKRLKCDEDIMKDGGIESDAVEKRTTKNTKGIKKTAKSSKRLKFDEDIIKDKIHARDALKDSVTLKSDMERLEEAKMIKMEAHFRGKQNESCAASTRKSYAPWSRDSSAECLQRRRLVAARSRERLLNLRPAKDTTNTFLCPEIVDTIRAELGNYQRLRDALGYQQETRQVNSTQRQRRRFDVSSSFLFIVCNIWQK
ncbi:uncharacterized protein LOC127871973 isoform X1 [Dreissena polymorpha]|uniref:uncharacterized protein LOC127871973 isoform X1 n=1 Tax=Dreissena polymorpha TaxID=45954 RepID=UPI0022643091|nr:uncharacterized protein LOC127871973 isoform X1 [Dreissena polymorpha]